jgi:hypothetical protein
MIFAGLWWLEAAKLQSWKIDLSSEREKRAV